MKARKALLRNLAADYRRRLQGQRRTIEAKNLCEFVHEVSPYLAEPRHLAPYCDTLERAPKGNLRVVFAAPPQHGKTETTLRAFLWWDRTHPKLRHAYVTYSQTQAREVAKAFWTMCREAGIELSGTIERPTLPNGSRIRFTSVDGALTGSAVDGVCVIDDPIKNAVDARSEVKRRRAIDFYKSVARTRRHDGTSFIVMATRWHMADLSGHLTDEKGFEYINLKAIAETTSQDDLDKSGRVISDPLHRKPGEALWASHKPPEFFDEERQDAFWWQAMYQGNPRPDGAVLFSAPGDIDEEGKPRGPGYYRELPSAGYRGAFGLDLAYTAKTRADFSVLIEGVVYGGKLYIVDVVRKQVDAPSFGLTLKAKQAKRPGWPMRWYVGATEKASADFFRRQRIRIKAIQATADKLVRATPAAADWNAGNILLPDVEAFPQADEWIHDFLEVVCKFTGDNDARDDDVDALAALRDQLMKTNKMTAALRKRSGKPT